MSTIRSLIERAAARAAARARSGARSDPGGHAPVAEEGVDNPDLALGVGSSIEDAILDGDPYALTIFVPLPASVSGSPDSPPPSSTIGVQIREIRPIGADPAPTRTEGTYTVVGKTGAGFKNRDRPPAAILRPFPNAIQP